MVTVVPALCVGRHARGFVDIGVGTGGAAWSRPYSVTDGTGVGRLGRPE